jgi:general secretion pathway protein K
VRGGTVAGQHRRRSDAGVALLLAVWLLALLAVIVGELVFSTRVRVAAERNKRDDLRAWALAVAGYRAALAALDDNIAGLSLNEEGGLLLHYRGESSGTPAAATDVPLGDGSYSWRVVSEDGLVDVNGDTLRQRSVLANLLKQCGLGPGADRDTVIDSILDWRDTNREHRLNGAEEDYYRALDPPYSCKDGALDVLEELLLVRGVTPELFFGKRERDRPLPGLRDLLSVHSFEFNPGTAPKTVLEALGRARPARPTAPGSRYRILATGKPGAGAPARSLQAVVERDDAGDSRTFTLLYWNDTISPELSGERAPAEASPGG